MFAEVIRYAQTLYFIFNIYFWLHKSLLTTN